jgi:dTDP-4-dehydrorhamnose reductase
MSSYSNESFNFTNDNSLNEPFEKSEPTTANNTFAYSNTNKTENVTATMNKAAAILAETSFEIDKCDQKKFIYEVDKILKDY